MATYTLLQIEQLFSQAIGDDLEFDSTTTIPGGAATITSTTLNSYDSGQDDYFNNWWVYITEGVNITANRQISDYTTSGGVLAVRGANLSTEAGAVTCRLHRYNRDIKKWAILRALEKLYPTVYHRLDDITLITNNVLPNAHAEDWTSSFYPDFYSLTSATSAAIATAGNYWGGVNACKVTASAANGYLYISSNTFPRLLDLNNSSVTFKARALPQTANDAWLVIYTKQADGTAQTLTSATTNPAGEFTQLVLENQTLNDNLVEVELRFGVTTSGQYVVFDDWRLESPIHEYVLPKDFRLGHLSQVYIQSSGKETYACDDLRPQTWHWVDHKTYHDNTYEYLYLPDIHPACRRMRLVGSRPFTLFSSDSDAIVIDGERTNLIVACAAAEFYQRLRGATYIGDKDRFTEEAARWRNETQRLFYSHGMPVLSERVQA